MITLAVYRVAERYAAEVLAASAQAEPLTPKRVARELGRGWPMLEAALLPAVVLLVVALSTGHLRAGTLTALAVATVLLGYLGRLAAHRGLAASNGKWPRSMRRRSRGLLRSGLAGRGSAIGGGRYRAVVRGERAGRAAATRTWSHADPRRSRAVMVQRTST